jgi:hypothetical protein
MFVVMFCGMTVCVSMFLVVDVNVVTGGGMISGCGCGLYVHKFTADIVDKYMWCTYGCCSV